MIRTASQKVEEIKRSISEYIEKVDSHPIAAFDADGTLWNMDMSEAFFQYKVKNKLLQNLPPEPWSYYRELHSTDPRKAYLWLAQVNEGIPLETVRGWATDFLENHGDPKIITVQKDIIDFLQSLSVEVYVVTASIKWAVEPGASKYYNIPRENVIGVRTKISEGVITTEQEGPITWREGKVEGLLEKTKGKIPFFCSGNTMGDLPLLELSQHLRWVVSMADKDSPLFPTESELLLLAQNRAWHSHSFVHPRV